MFETLPPALLTAVPGPRSRALAERLAAVESRNVTALAPVPPIFWERAAGANVEGAVVQARVGAGREVIVGARRDPVFGPVLVVGAGGTAVEELGSEAARRLLPLAQGEADALATGLGGGKALAGAIESVELLSLALGEELEALELNPVILTGDGTATAVDGLLLVGGYAEE